MQECEYPAMKERVRSNFVEVIEGAADKPILSKGVHAGRDLYSFSLQALKYNLEREGITVFSKQASLEFIEAGWRKGLIDDASRTYLKNEIAAGKTLQAILQTEVKDATGKTVVKGEVLKDLTVDEFEHLIAAHHPISMETINYFKGFLDPELKDKVVMLSPKYFLVKEGTEAMDAEIGMTLEKLLEQKKECTLFLVVKNQKTREYETRACPSKSSAGKVLIGLGWIRTPDIPDFITTAIPRLKNIDQVEIALMGSTNFYTASPAKVDIYLRYSDLEGRNDIMAFVDLGKYPDYSPNFAYAFPARFPEKVPSPFGCPSGVRMCLKDLPLIGGLDTGFAPWPCHGLYGIAVAKDWAKAKIEEKLGTGFPYINKIINWVTDEMLDSKILRKLVGTC
jgi:hypothetical protein